MIHAYYAIPNNLYVLFTSKFEKKNQPGVYCYMVHSRSMNSLKKWNIRSLPSQCLLKKRIFQSAEIKY